jgi:enoyl-CoA hydratase
VLKELKTLLTSITNEAFNNQLFGLILTGEGEKAFIAGADIAAMQKMTKEQVKEFGKLGQDVSLMFENLPIPVIAAVNGFALGGGCEMAMSCDIILAVNSATFGQPEVKLGIIPGFGGTQRLAKLIGLARAREWTYSGRNIKALEAKEAGLVLELLENNDQLLVRARELLKSFFVNSPLAISKCKFAINKGVDLPTANGLEIELDVFANIFTSHDTKEGISAFLEKRKANFTAK